jgi:hypothetical protein
MRMKKEKKNTRDASVSSGSVRATPPTDRPLPCIPHNPSLPRQLYTSILSFEMRHETMVQTPFSRGL